MKYFTIEGKSVIFDKDSFINEYQNCYYLDNGENGVPKHTHFSRISANCKVAENEIERILNDGILSKDDVNLLLAWKIGGIDHKKSMQENSVQFISSWGGEDSSSVLVNNGLSQFRCSKDLFDKFCSEIVRISKSYQGKYDSDIRNDIIKEIESAIESANVLGLGAVYILTLLYFITRGQSPIFDRCAYRAVKAIYREMKVKDIWYENPSSSEAPYIIRIINDYEWYLSKIFGTKCIDRSVDRALWVYGHTKLSPSNFKND